MIRIPTGWRQTSCLFTRITEELNQAQMWDDINLWTVTPPKIWHMTVDIRVNTHCYNCVILKATPKEDQIYCLLTYSAGNNNRSSGMSDQIEMSGQFNIMIGHDVQTCCPNKFKYSSQNFVLNSVMLIMFTQIANNVRPKRRFEMTNVLLWKKNYFQHACMPKCM